MSQSFYSTAAVTSTRSKILDVVPAYPSTISLLCFSTNSGNGTFEVYLDKEVNDLAIPAQPTLANATTGGNLPASTTYFVRICTVDANGKQGPGSDTKRSVVTGVTATNKITVTISAVSGAASYNVYLGRNPGDETYIGNTVSTTFVITDETQDLVTRPACDPDLKFIGTAAVPIPYQLAPGALTAYSRITAWCTNSGNGTAFVSIMGS